MQACPIVRPCSGLNKAEPLNSAIAEKRVRHTHGAEEETLNSLPDESLEVISSNLNLEDWKNFALVNKGIRKIAIERMTKAKIRVGDLATEKPLEALTKLSHVILRGTVTPQIICNLRKKAPNLKTLEITHCSAVGSETLEALSGLTHLTSLKLSGFSVEDEGLNALSKLNHLSSLDLSLNRNISNEGVQALSRLTELTTLKLSGIKKITDESLKTLSKLPHLATLKLDGNITVKYSS